MKATTPTGSLVPIPNMTINIPGCKTINLDALPDLSGAKGAMYNDEAIIGRSFPLKTYSHSDNRVFNLTLHFYLIQQSDIATKFDNMRALQSAAYPRDANGFTPFVPPPVCQLQIGKLLGDNPVCAVLLNCSEKFPIDVVWVEDNGIYLPIKFDVETTWHAVYRSDQLPGQAKIYSSGA